MPARCDLWRMRRRHAAEDARLLVLSRLSSAVLISGAAGRSTRLTRHGIIGIATDKEPEVLREAPKQLGASTWRRTRRGSGRCGVRGGRGQPRRGTPQAACCEHQVGHASPDELLLHKVKGGWLRRGRERLRKAQAREQHWQCRCSSAAAAEEAQGHEHRGDGGEPLEAARMAQPVGPRATTVLVACIAPTGRIARIARRLIIAQSKTVRQPRPCPRQEHRHRAIDEHPRRGVRWIGCSSIW